MGMSRPKVHRGAEPAKMDDTEKRQIIKYLFKKGIPSQEIYEDMVDTFGDDSTSYTIIAKWVGEYQRGREKVKDDGRLIAQERAPLIFKLIS